MTSPPVQPDSEPAPPPAKTARKRWMLVIKVLLVGALFAWVIRSIAEDASSLDWSNLVRDPVPILGAIGLWAFVFLFRAWLWGEMMRRIGYPVGHVAGARVFLASHLGRFLPGKVWSVAGAGLFGREHGLPARESAVAMTMFLIIYYMMGSLAALLVIWQLGEAQVLIAIAIGVGGLGALGFLGSPLFPRLLRWLGRKFKRDMTNLRLPSPGVLALVALGLAGVWVGAGAAFAVMAGGIVPEASGEVSLVVGIGTYASALVAGFAALFAPAGLGVREVVMLELLQPSVGAALAGIVTICSRVIITSMELVFSLWGALPFLLARRRDRGDAA